MGKKLNLKILGKYNRLTIIRENGKTKHGNIIWLCKCDCGKETIVQGRFILNGKIKSCGCLKNELLIERQATHRLSKSKLYTIWCAIKNRCYNKNFQDYKNYGGRGIDMCERWKSDFCNFYDDMHQDYFKGAEIDRIDVNKGYYPDNCKWSNRKEQQRNKRNNHFIEYMGTKLTLIEWEEKIGTKANTILTRIRRGWSIEDAIFGK